MAHMKFQKDILLTALFLLGMANTGCVDLKGVNSFARSSQATLDESRTLSYGYASYCADSCYIYNNAGKELKDFICDCGHATAYDTALQKEFSALSAYFGALAKMSGTSKVISAAPLGTSMAAGTYGRFTISTAESGIAGALATAATYVLTTHYKSTHIEDTVKKYGPDVDNYIEILALHLDNLKNEIRVLETELQQKCVVFINTVPTDTERWELFSAYKEKKESLDKVIAEYDRKQKLIQHIRDGHQQMVQNAATLGSKDLKKLLTSLVDDITYLSNSKTD